MVRQSLRIVHPMWALFFAFLVPMLVVPLAPSQPAWADVSAAEQQTFVDSSGAAAKPSQQQYGVPPSVTVAQAILESNWGTSDLAVHDHNYFGMKCKDGDAGSLSPPGVLHI